METTKQVPVDDNLGEIINWAVRYALGRRTYAVLDTCRYVQPLIPYLNNRTLWCISRDIIQQEPLGYGDICDEEQWMELLKDVDEEIKSRKNNMFLDSID